MIFRLLLFCACIACGIADASGMETNEDPAQAVSRGNALYDEGKFKEAASQYEAAITGGLDNGHLFYNLGNSYYRLGMWGKAIASYRKALSLLPDDPDVRANLRLARQKAVDRIEDAERPLRSLEAAVLSPYSLWSKDELLKGFLFLYTVFWVLFVLRGLQSNGWVNGAFIVSLLLVMYGAASLITVRYDRNGEAVFAISEDTRALAPAVVIVPEAQVYSGNSETFQVVSLLHNGTEISTRHRRNGWVEVLLPGDRRGWVKEDTVDILQ